MMQARGMDRKGRYAPAPMEVDGPSRRGQRSASRSAEKLRKLGNIYVLYQFKNRKLIVLGPDWCYSLIMLTILLVVGIGYVSITVTRINTWYHWLSGVFMSIVVPCSFLACVLKDPGIVRPHVPTGADSGEMQPITANDNLSSSSSSEDDEESDEILSSSSSSGDLVDYDDYSLPEQLDVDEVIKKGSRRQVASVGLHGMRKASTTSDGETELYEEDLKDDSDSQEGVTGTSYVSSEHSVKPHVVGHPAAVGVGIEFDPAELQEPNRPMTLGDRFLHDLEMHKDSEPAEPSYRRRQEGTTRTCQISAAASHTPNKPRTIGQTNAHHSSKPSKAELAAMRRRRVIREAQTSRYCESCGVTPPVGSYHCEDCEVCIEGYDHHCPWTSKCIGSNNICEFYLWIFNGIITMVYMGIMTGVSLHPEHLTGRSTHPH